MKPVNYKRSLFYLLVFTAVFKIIIASFVELGNDEVYYYTYALRPDWSYFDHPPMIGLLIRLTTFNLHWVNDISMRLGAIIGCGISTYFIFFTGKVINNERTGWYAALLYNCSVYTGIIAGLFILPDSPQMPFWTASLYIMSRILFQSENSDSSFRRFPDKTSGQAVPAKSFTNTADCHVGQEPNLAMTFAKNKLYFLLLGLTIGLATLSKVHALFLWAEFGLFILIKQRKLFANWVLYAAGIITLFCLLPIVYWNVQNHFITYTFHSERVTHHTVQFDSLLQELVGEMLYQNPIIYVLIIVAAIYFIKQRKLFSSNISIWLLCMSVPMLLVFWGVALFNPTLPHWSGPAYIPLLLVAAIYIEKKLTKIIPIVVQFAGGLIILVLITGTALANLAPFNLGSKDAANYGEYCPTLDISGWQNFGKTFAALVEKDKTDHLMKADAPIVVAKWFPAAHIEMYVARRSHQEVIGMGKLEDLHEFAWLNNERKKLQSNDDAYCIVPSNLPFNVIENYHVFFGSIEPPVIINQTRGGKAVRYFYVYRLKGYKLQ